MSSPTNRTPIGRGERRLMTGMVLITIAICAAMLINNASGSDGNPDAAEETSPAAATETPPAVVIAAATKAEVELRATGEQVIVDVFERPGLEGGDLDWDSISGTWRVDVDDAAEKLSADPESDGAARGVFVPPADLGDRWELIANIGQPGANMGLVWAVEDADNYWEVRLVPDSAAIVVNQVVEGQSRQVALFGPAGLNSGDSLRIQRDGDSVLLAVGDEVLGAWTHPDLTERRRAGIFASPGGGGFGSVLVANLGEPTGG